MATKANRAATAASRRVGIVVLTGIVTMMNNLNKSNLNAQQQAETTLLQNDIYSLLRHQGACASTFATIAAQDVGQPKSAVATLVRADSTVAFQTGLLYAGSKLQLQSLELGDFVAENPAVDPHSGKAVLHVTLSKPGQPLGPRTLVRGVKLQATRNPVTRRVTSCVAIGGTKELWVLEPSGNIHYDGGNVRVGVSNPGARLDVAGGIRPGGVTTGAACTMEGAFAYDYAAHAPVFCSDTGVWKGMGGAVTTTTDCQTLPWGGTVHKQCPSGYVLVGAQSRGSDSGEWNYMYCCRLGP